MIELFKVFLIQIFVLILFSSLICSKGKWLQTSNLYYRLIAGKFLIILSTAFFHFFFPVDTILSLILLIIPIFFVLNFQSIRNDISLVIKNIVTIKSLIVSGLSFFIVLLIVRSQPLSPYDSGLYHFPLLKWFQEYPLITGLGNLHARLSFNNTWFYYISFFGNFVNKSFYHYYFVSFWLFFIIHYILNSLLFLIIPKYQIFLNLTHFLVLIILLLNPLFVVSVSPDSISYYLSLFFLMETASYLFRFKRNEFLYLVPLFIVMLLGTKVISILIAFPLLAIIKSLPLKSKKFQKNISKSLLLSILFFSVYCFRGYLLSGYISYPLSITVGSPDWQIPESTRLGEEREIKGWARHPGNGYLESLDLPVRIWTLEWWNRYKNENYFQLFPYSLGIFLFSLFVHTYNSKGRKYILFQFLLLISLVAWFLNAPDPRFNMGLIVFSISILLSGIFFNIHLQRFQMIKLNFIRVLVVLFLLKHGSYLYQNKKEKIYIPEVQTLSYSIQNGIFRKPVDGLETCWQADLPCGPYFINNLHLRTGELIDGFSVK